MSSNPTASLRQHSFVVLPRFLYHRQRAELRLAADTALAWSRHECHETSHTTPRISLLTQGSSFEQGATALAPVLNFASDRRVCALLDAVARAEPTGLLQLKDVHYYHEQTRRDWDGDWHRDSQFARADPELEHALIASTYSLHFRVALEDDDRLEIVPGSHARWDSDEELSIRRGPQRATNKMPGAFRVVLAAGDACLFDAWAIHRATYRQAPLRRTLDLLYGSARLNPPR